MLAFEQQKYMSFETFSLLSAAANAISAGFHEFDVFTSLEGTDSHSLNPQALSFHEDGDIKVVHNLPGEHPVARPSEGASAIDNGFKPGPNGGPSPIEQISEKGLENDPDFSPEKREAFMKWLQQHKDAIIAASHGDGTANIDGVQQFTFDKDGIMTMADGTKIQYKDGLILVMTHSTENGGFGSEVIKLVPATSESGVVAEFTYEKDGVMYKERVRFWGDCSNISFDKAEDEVVLPVATAPAEVCCEPGERTVVGEEITGPRAHPEDTITAAVVTEKVGNVDDIWDDKNKDGHIWHIEHTTRGDVYCLDEDEINMKVLPNRDQISADIEEYQSQHGGKLPEHLWYTFTDCNGKSVVLCYNLETEKWGVLKDMTWTPEGQDADSGPAIDTKEELDAYLTKERVVAK